MPGSPRPFVTVVMPVFDEGRFIERSLKSVLAQTYPPDRLEIFVVDGMSSDGTRQLAEQIARTSELVRVFENPARIIPTALNLGMLYARGDVIVRVDGHTEIPPDYVERCVTELHRNGAMGVGGALEIVGETWLSRGIAVAQSSFMGAGNVAYRRRYPGRQYVDTVPYAAYQREVIEKTGGWDERLIRHEDYEFNSRLREAGGKLLYVPEITARYFCRDTLQSLWKQYFRYGYWKGRVARERPKVLAVRHLAPITLVFLAVLGALLAYLVPWFARAYFVGFAAYLVAVSAASVSLARSKGWRHLPVLPPALVAIHIGWGTGFWTGLLSLSQFTKRLADILLALIGLILFTIALPFFAAAIYIDSGRPIFYTQMRVGLKGKHFRIYKLRTMRHGAEEGDEARWAGENDPRVTRVGRLLRRTQLDEIPQVLNVLKGDMSAVGPRPERPDFVNPFLETVPLYQVRHSVRPGMAGWALVNLGYSASEADSILKLQYDLYYVCNQSFWLDMVILARTAWRSLTMKGR